MDQHRHNLISALAGFAKFHLAADASSQVEYMDGSDELYCRWTGAYIKRDWFLGQFSSDQRIAMEEFDKFLHAATAKYNNLPPLLQLVTSKSGREICARAKELLTLLEAP